MSNAISRKLAAIEEKGAMRAADVANLLNTRPQAVHRWSEGKAFPLPGAEMQLLALEFIIDELSDFYTPQEARMWLYAPQRLLGDVSPAELIQEGRAQEVIAVVNQLRDGVYV